MTIRGSCRGRRLNGDHLSVFPDISLVIGTYQADHDHIAFLSLEAVYRVSGYQAAERFEESVALDQSADILNLRFVR